MFHFLCREISSLKSEAGILLRVLKKGLSKSLQSCFLTQYWGITMKLFILTISFLCLLTTESIASRHSAEGEAKDRNENTACELAQQDARYEAEDSCYAAGGTTSGFRYNIDYGFGGCSCQEFAGRHHCKASGWVRCLID